MKKKFPIKSAPDATVYLTANGTRVRIARSKQFPAHPSDQPWMKELREKANEEISVIRISDGHVLWGVNKADLVPET